MIRKFVELKSLKTVDEGPGTIEGYRAVFSVDKGGDLIVKGAFRGTIDEYLSSGFTAESHSWTFSNAVGFPVVAREDDHGLFVVSQFHSTPDAQNVRTKAKERMAAGKQVGFSFGYSVGESDFIDSQNYERELPKYVKPAELTYNLNMARRFPRIRLLKKLSMIEDSLVTVPMNSQAASTGVKSIRSKTVAQLRYESTMLQARTMVALYGEPDDVARLRRESLRLQGRRR
jgi:HK97 family phage prohead protease